MIQDRHRRRPSTNCREAAILLEQTDVDKPGDIIGTLKNNPSIGYGMKESRSRRRIHLRTHQHTLPLERKTLMQSRNLLCGRRSAVHTRRASGHIEPLGLSYLRLGLQMSQTVEVHTVLIECTKDQGTHDMDALLSWNA